MKYEEQMFTLPELKGISAKQIEVHLGLYSGYVKHVNVLREQIQDLSALDKEKYAYAIAELRRRLGFEFDGMRMHEYYFKQFEGGSQILKPESPLSTLVAEKYENWDGFILHFTTVGKMRGIGWTVLYFDPVGKTPHVAWVGDHELGQLSGLPIILAMDMWEHAYMVDYVPSEKAKYIQAFLENVNWNVAEERYSTAR